MDSCFFMFVNREALRRENKIVPVEPSTMKKKMTHLQTRIKELTRYRIVDNPHFQSFRDTINAYNTNSTANFGLNVGANIADPFTLAELEWMLNHEALSIFWPFGIYAKFYMLFTLLCNPRVNRETHDLCR